MHAYALQTCTIKIICDIIPFLLHLFLFFIIISLWDIITNNITNKGDLNIILCTTLWISNVKKRIKIQKTVSNTHTQYEGMNIGLDFGLKLQKISRNQFFSVDCAVSVGINFDVPLPTARNKKKTIGNSLRGMITNIHVIIGGLMVLKKNILYTVVQLDLSVLNSFKWF